MKLVFDENLSHRLVAMLVDVYPDSVHVRDVGLKGADDEHIWSYASEHGLVITSKDVDFYQRSLLRGGPPKVLWIHVGNAPTSTIAQLLRDRLLVVSRFGNDDEASFLTLALDGVG